MTDNFNPYEPEPDYDYEYDDYPEDNRRRPNVLWGRLIVLLVALLLAFWLGRITAGGVDEGEVKDLRAEVAKIREENAQLEDQVAAAQEASQDEPDGAGETPDADATDAEDPELETYTVESGDTLRAIAETYCGDPEMDDLIAATNGIDDKTQLFVGETLTLPAECSG